MYVPSTSSWHVKQQPPRTGFEALGVIFSQVIGDFWAISQNQSTKLRRSRRRPKSTTDGGLQQPSQLVRPAGPRRATRCDLWRAQYLRPLCLPAAFALFDLPVWSLSQCYSGSSIRSGCFLSRSWSSARTFPATLLVFPQPIYPPKWDCGPGSFLSATRSPSGQQTAESGRQKPEAILRQES